MYYFRCEVTKCSHLKWEVSGEEVLEVFPYSSRNDIIPADPLNLLIHTISQSDVETETNFTSYLWFNSSFYPSNENRNDFEIVCRGRHSNKTMTLKIPGNLKYIHYRAMKSTQPHLVLISRDFWARLSLAIMKSTKVQTLGAYSVI